MYRKRGSLRGGTVLAAGAFVLFGCATAPADTIFNDFGAGGSSQLQNYCVDGSVPALICSSGLSSGNPLAPAALFTSAGNYNVTQIDLGLVYNEGANSAVVSLFTDEGDAPGTLIDSWNLSNLPANSPPVVTISGITGVTLTSGSYFLEVSPGASDTSAGWDFNSTGVMGTVYDPPFGGVETLPAFDVLGTAVPEPGSLAVCAAALLALMAWRRKRSASAHN